MSNTLQHEWKFDNAFAEKVLLPYPFFKPGYYAEFGTASIGIRNQRFNKKYEKVMIDRVRALKAEMTFNSRVINEYIIRGSKDGEYGVVILMIERNPNGDGAIILSGGDKSTAADQSLFSDIKNIVTSLVENPDSFYTDKEVSVSALNVVNKKLGLDKFTTGALTDKLTGFLGTPVFQTSL